ncbi:MAG: hypothetical protein AAF491_11465, partial [Verrucomicrobiota bacterium]
HGWKTEDSSFHFVCPVSLLSPTFMKALLRISAVTVMASGGLGGYSMTVGKDTTVGMQIQQVIQKTANAFSIELPEMDWIDSQEMKERAAYEPILQACLTEMFFEKNGYYFTQSKWGAESVPYQFRGLEVIGPKKRTTNGADQAREIEARYSFEFYVEAYRSYDKTEGWGSWKVDTPPNLDSITLVLHAGTWKVAASPQRYYNLK